MMPITINFRPADQLDGDNHLGESAGNALVDGIYWPCVLKAKYVLHLLKEKFNFHGLTSLLNII